MKNNYKKAQIGQTITWVVATVIILLILFLFVFISGEENFKNALGIGSKISSSESDFGEQQMLFAILNKKVNGVLIKEMIIQSKLDDAEKEIGNCLDEFKKNNVECNLFLQGGVKGFSIKKSDFYSALPIGAQIQLNNYLIRLECWR